MVLTEAGEFGIWTNLNSFSLIIEPCKSVIRQVGLWLTKRKGKDELSNRSTSFYMKTLTPQNFQLPWKRKKPRRNEIYHLN